jgi:Flp pilus assembly protein TadD
VSTAPGDAGARSNLATTLVKLGRIDEAVPHFREALRLDPGLSRARAGLAACELELGEAVEPAR